MSRFTIFLCLLLKFCRYLLPSLVVSFSWSEKTRLDVVLGLDLLPLSFHSRHDTMYLSSEGFKNQRSSCWKSRVEVEATVVTFQPGKSNLAGIVFWANDQSRGHRSPKISNITDLVPDDLRQSKPLSWSNPVHHPKSCRGQVGRPQVSLSPQQLVIPGLSWSPSPARQPQRMHPT